MSAEPFQSLPPRAKEPPPLVLSSQPRRVVLGGGAAEANRTLILGVLIVLLTIPVGGAAFWWAPRETFVAVTTAILVGLLVFLAMQFRVLLQRNGTFLILALAFAMTLAVPLASRLVAAGSDWMLMFADLPRARAQVSAGVGGNADNAVAKTSNSNVKPGEKGDASTQGASMESATVISSAPQAGAPGRPMMPPKAPELEAPKGGYEVPSVEPESAKPGEDAAQRATRLAKEEAVRRYPALQTPGTQEHTKYIEAYNELARLRKFEFFKDPNWPLNLAETVASREGWRRFGEATPTQEPAPNAGGKLALMPGSEIALDGQPSPTPEPAEAQGANTQAVNRSMIEARRRYPAIGKEGSPENQAYVEYYKDMDRVRPEFFEKPDWPLRLAEAVARREGWKRADGGDNRSMSEVREPALPR